MALPKPIPGLIIRYSYLWHREHIAGREEGQKDRPCAVVAALSMEKTGAIRMLVLPITHVQPDPGADSIEIPAQVKARLQMDGSRSWVVLSEWNEFAWPGPDLRPLAEQNSTGVAYGVLPPALFNAIRDRFVSLVRSRQSKRVLRT